MEKQIKGFLGFLKEEKKMSLNTLQSYERDVLQFEKYLHLIQSPTPYIIGLDPSLMQILDLTDIVVFVDIDNGKIKSTDS